MKSNFIELVKKIYVMGTIPSVEFNNDASYDKILKKKNPVFSMVIVIVELQKHQKNPTVCWCVQKNSIGICK